MHHPQVIPDTIHFVDSVGGVQIRINGESLIEILRRIEQPQAETECIAGGYTNIAAIWLYPQLKRGSRNPRSRFFVLVCPCGAECCWSWSIRITRKGGTVTWSDARLNHRPEWIYPAFQFHRKQYRQALCELKRAYRADTGARLKNAPNRSEDGDRE